MHHRQIRRTSLGKNLEYRNGVALVFQNGFLDLVAAEGLLDLLIRRLRDQDLPGFRNALQTLSGIDNVADDSAVEAAQVGRPDIARNHFARMDANRDLGVEKNVASFVRQLFDLLADREARVDRPVEVKFSPEDRQDGVADKFIDIAVLRNDLPDHYVEIFVQQRNYLVGF